MINGELKELIKQAQKAQADFLALAAGIDQEYRLAYKAVIQSKTLTGDLCAIRDPEIPGDYKLEALERIARRYFSLNRIYGRQRRDFIRNAINERAIENDYTWLKTWSDTVLAEIFIAVLSDDIGNSPINQVFKKARSILRASIEIELLGKTLDSQREKQGERRKTQVHGTRPLSDSDEKRLFEGNFKLINLAGESTRQNARGRFYTGFGLEDRSIEIMAIRDIINAVGVKDVDYFLTEDPPETRAPELQPAKDKWPLINANNYRIRKKIIAAARRLGYRDY